MQAAPKGKYLIDEAGKTSAVLLSVREYRRLVKAWEEVADAEDFQKARKTAKSFVTVQELRSRVLK